MTRTRLRGDWYSVQGPDENHDYYAFLFTDESMKNDVIIEMVDIQKFIEALDKFDRRNGGSEVK